MSREFQGENTVMLLEAEQTTEAQGEAQAGSPQPPGGAHPTSTLMSDLRSPELGGNGVLWFKPLRCGYFVIAAPAD